VSFKDFRYACEVLGLKYHDKDLQNFFNYLDFPTKDRHLTLEDINSRFFFMAPKFYAPSTNSTISLLTSTNKREKTPVMS
jgi:hypothetical protein